MNVENKSKVESTSPSNDASGSVPSGFILKLYQMVNGAPDEVISVSAFFSLNEKKNRSIKCRVFECFWIFRTKLSSCQSCVYVWCIKLSERWEKLEDCLVVSKSHFCSSLTWYSPNMRNSLKFLPRLKTTHFNPTEAVFKPGGLVVNFFVKFHHFLPSDPIGLDLLSKSVLWHFFEGLFYAFPQKRIKSTGFFTSYRVHMIVLCQYIEFVEFDRDTVTAKPDRHSQHRIEQIERLPNPMILY